jgi:hypothetical protein
MGFCPRKCMGYGVLESYGFFLALFSGNQLGGAQNLWGFTNYRLWKLWVKTA